MERKRKSKKKKKMEVLQATLRSTPFALIFFSSSLFLVVESCDRVASVLVYRLKFPNALKFLTNNINNYSKNKNYSSRFDGTNVINL